jgi:formylglycine-generating enzyme required for sulfatase activity
MPIPRPLRTPLALVSLGLSLLAVALPSPGVAEAKPKKTQKGCPAGMVSVRGSFCIDKFEASTVEILGKSKKTRPHSAFSPVDGLKVKAVSKKGVYPQAHISRDQAEAACENAGKRLCTDDEWITACRGKSPTVYPYGDEHKAGACNDRGVSSFNFYYGVAGAEAPKDAYTWANMNDPRLNQLKGTLAKTGSHKQCRSGYGAYDMVGNLHEWTADPKGTFRGGYYLDTHLHGDGCDYKTTAHKPKYYDYSTGFRCCK